MTVGTHIIGYKNPITNVVSNQFPVYQYKDPSTGMTVVVTGTLTTTVTDISTASMPNTYMAVVTITYSYLNHDGVHQPKYSFSMTAIRTSDI